LLERRSGNPTSRAFSKLSISLATTGLNFYAFTMFTDRDGKYQLSALAESGFEPLARTCRFMLTEGSASHVCRRHRSEPRRQTHRQLMKQNQRRCARARRHSARHHPEVHQLLVQLLARLFGGEISSNSADFFARRTERAFQRAGAYTITLRRGSVHDDGGRETASLCRAKCRCEMRLNEVLRGEYVKDCEKGLARWNKALADEGLSERLSAEHSFPSPRGRIRRPLLRHRRESDFERRISKRRNRMAADNRGLASMCAA
jgi:benzoyl-CoA 2,3-dioxygenase component B